MSNWFASKQDPNNETILRNIFRLVHTIKGTCGFLGLPRLEALAHAAETLMGKFPRRPSGDHRRRFADPADAGPDQGDRRRARAHRREPEGEDQDLIGALDAMSNADPEALVFRKQAGSAQVSSEVPADTAADEAPEAGGIRLPAAGAGPASR